MTVHLDLPAELVERLNQKAAEQGLSLTAYLVQAVLGEAANGRLDPDSEKHRRATAASCILEIRKRVRPDPEGWTSRDYIRYGRR
ncbi:MAG TPA: hypothetical protein VGF59_07860 [Bryobacteraceae bacterium]|jgi:hypothetical protein